MKTPITSDITNKPIPFYRVYSLVLATMLGIGLTYSAQGQIYVVNDGNISEYSTGGDLINSSLVSGQHLAGPITSDEAGNLYVLNGGGFPFNGGGFSKYTSSGSLVYQYPHQGGALISPIGIAYSGGNLFIPDEFSGGDFYMKLFDASTGNGGNVIGPYLSNLTSVVAASGNNWYVSIYGNGGLGTGMVYYGQQGRILSGLDSAGLALDGQGNLFVADSGSGTIKEYNASSGQLENPALISGLNNLSGLAFDGQGDLFVGYGSGIIGEFTTSGQTVNATLISGVGGSFTVVVPEPSPAAFVLLGAACLLVQRCLRRSANAD